MRGCERKGREVGEELGIERGRDLGSIPAFLFAGKGHDLLASSGEKGLGNERFHWWNSVRDLDYFLAVFFFQKRCGVKSSCKN